MLLMIDNYDSFTYNLVQYFGELGIEVKVCRHDKTNLKAISKLNPDYIVISPGPCTPNEAGISLAVIKQFAGHIPILGVCLGHQAIGQAFGGDIVHARQIMHGKTSPICHNNSFLFKNLPATFKVTRYHSLVIAKSSLPSCFDVTAWTQQDDGSVDEIMAIQHKTLNLAGVQFHPESILTEHGHALLKNFLTCRQTS